MSGLFGFSGPTDPELAERMARALAHRGRLQPSIDASPEGTLGFQSHRVPLEGSGAGLSSSRSRALALAGTLEEVDGGQCSAADLWRLYDLEGIEFVRRLRGAFVLVIRDGATWHLVRDGAGRRTLNYALHGGRLLFAIEPKGILADPSFPRTLRPAALAQYLTFSFVPDSGTMLEGLFELPAGHRLSWSGGEPRLVRYFRFEEVEKDVDGDPERWVERFRDEHARAVERLRPRDGSFGVFLSGGIDSSIVTAEIARQSRDPVRTFAIHFGAEYPNELEHARAVANACGTDHEEVEIRPHRFLPRLREIVWHLDDPIGDPVAMPNFELAAHARRSVGSVYNGEGGDPCFGGPKNIPMLLHHWYGHPRDPDFRERHYLASYRRAYEEFPRLLTPEWRARIDPERDLVDVVRPYLSGSSLPHFLDRLAALNIRQKGAHLILPKVERMLGAVDLRPLSPLFSERLVEFSFAMPPRLRLDRGIEKAVLKRAYEDVLPRSIIDRPKSGMRVPVHYWCQGELKRYVRKILAPKEIRRAGIFEPARVKQLLDYNTEEGPGRYGLRLWMLMTFEIWRRLVIEREPL